MKLISTAKQHKSWGRMHQTGAKVHTGQHRMCQSPFAASSTARDGRSVGQQLQTLQRLQTLLLLNLSGVFHGNDSSIVQDDHRCAHAPHGMRTALPMLLSNMHAAFCPQDHSSFCPWHSVKKTLLFLPFCCTTVRTTVEHKLIDASSVPFLLRQTCQIKLTDFRWLASCLLQMCHLKVLN